MTSHRIKDLFTALHQQIDDRILVEPDRFTALLDDGGIERIIQASTVTPQGHQGVLTTPDTIDGEPIEFKSYAYLSRADIINVWSEAVTAADGEPKILATCRLGWSDPGTIGNTVHASLSEMMQIAGMRNDPDKDVTALRATLNKTYDIAHDMGHRIIRDLSRAETRTMAREQGLPHMPSRSLRSFGVADVIIEVSTSDGETGYIAVEASYTADERDTDRAIRNAHYLRRMTGRPAWPAVSAMRIDDRIKHLVECGVVHWHQLEQEDLIIDRR